MSPALAGRFFTTELPGKLLTILCPSTNWTLVSPYTLKGTATRIEPNLPSRCYLSHPQSIPPEMLPEITLDWEQPS